MSNHESSSSGQPSPPRRWGAIVSIAAVSTLLALGMAELAVSFLVPVRDVGPSFTVDDPVYGKRIKANARITRSTPEFVMEFQTNAQGFRQQRSVEGGSRPVVFLGDSFTMGYGVTEGEQFVALLQSRLGELPMLNAGMGNNGNGRWLKFLLLAAPAYEPRLVVLQVMGNDYEDNVREGLFELRGSELLERPIPPPSRSRNLQHLVEAVPGLASSHLVGLLRQVWAVRAPADAQGDTPGEGAVALQSAVAAEDTSVAAGDALTLALIARAIEICQHNGWPVLGVSVEVTGTRLVQLEGLFASRGVALLRLPGKQERPDLYYRVDGHWNAAGHRHVAETLLPVLSDPSRLRK